jgi:predicted nucleotidyltransferase
MSVTEGEGDVMLARLVAEILATYPQTQAVYVFGSYVPGEQQADSDLDVAILLPHQQARAAGNLRLSDLQQRLSSRVGVEVDLVNLRQVSTVFQQEIINTGQRIYCPDTMTCDAFEALVLSLYTKLNEERAEILTDIRNSGRIYAP